MSVELALLIGHSILLTCLKQSLTEGKGLFKQTGEKYEEICMFEWWLQP
jgi:hypothetical protein